MMAAGKITAEERRKNEEYRTEMQGRVQSMAMGEGLKYGKWIPLNVRSG